MRFPRTHKAFRGQLDVAAFAGVFFLLALFLAFSGSLIFTPGVPEIGRASCRERV